MLVHGQASPKLERCNELLHSYAASSALRPRRLEVIMDDIGKMINRSLVLLTISRFGPSLNIPGCTLTKQDSRHTSGKLSLTRFQ